MKNVNIKTVGILLFFSFFICTFFIFDGSADLEECKQLDSIEFNHIVVRKTKLWVNHYIEKVYVKDLGSTHEFVFSERELNHGIDFYRMVEVGDTLIKAKLGDMIYIHKKGFIDSLPFEDCDDKKKYYQEPPFETVKK